VREISFIEKLSKPKNENEKRKEKRETM